MAKLGRSLLAGECTVDEFRKLTKRFDTAKHYIRDEMDSYAYDSVIVEGDLAIDGDFNTFERKLSRILVTGNLTVSGLYQDFEDPETAVFVLGEFEATNAITAGSLCVAGNLTVRDHLIGYYNDHCAEVLGSVRTHIFAPENHHFSIGKTLETDYVIGNGAEWRVSPKQKKAATPTADAILKTVIVPEINRGGISDDPEDELDLDNSVIRQRVAKGLRLLREGAPNKPAATARKPKKPAAARPAKKPAAKKPVAKKPAAKKSAAKKPTPKQSKKRARKPSR